MTLRPSANSVVAANSSRNVSYTCDDASSEEARLIWVLNDIQVWSEDQRQQLAATGVLVEVAEDSLSLVMTAEGRDTYDRLSVKCTSYTDATGRIGMGDSSLTFTIFKFGIVAFPTNCC